MGDYSQSSLLLPPRIDHRGHYKILLGGGGGGALRLGARDSSNRINSTCTIDVSETNLKCLSDFNYCSTLMTKVATNK